MGIFMKKTLVNICCSHVFYVGQQIDVTQCQPFSISCCSRVNLIMQWKKLKMVNSEIHSLAHRVRSLERTLQ